MVLTTTLLEAGTAPQAIATEGHRFAIWTDGSDRVGYSELIGETWSSPQYESFSGPEDLERARLTVKSIVLSRDNIATP